jgi:hypothetical protein
MHRRASRSLGVPTDLGKPRPRCSPRGSGCFALAQDLGRSLEAGIPRTARVKPSEVGLLFLRQANHYHMPPYGARSEWVAHRLGSNRRCSPAAAPHQGRQDFRHPRRSRRMADRPRRVSPHLPAAQSRNERRPPTGKPRRNTCSPPRNSRQPTTLTRPAVRRPRPIQNIEPFCVISKA